MIKAKVSTDYKDIERIFAGGSIQKEILKVWSTEADAYVFEAWKILEMEGPLPLTFKANGEPLIDYRIYGNTVQNGTPTPENPIMPIGCGRRTENLFDLNRLPSNTWTTDTQYYMNGGIITDTSVNPEQVSISVNNDTLSVTSNGGRGAGFLVEVEPSTEYRFTFTKSESFASDKTSCVYAFVDTSETLSTYNAIYGNSDSTVFTTGSNTKYVYFVFRKASGSISYSNIMLNTGSTTLPYEPYGYKLPILSNSAVTNVYLGEVETTRRIKKLAFNGNEKWEYDSVNTRFVSSLPGMDYKGARATTFLCSHYEVVDDGRSISRVPNNTAYAGGSVANPLGYVKTDEYSSAEDFKSYLASQYAAGTPVTVWYVLAEPETGIVNEPLMKIDYYADTIDSTQANVQIPTYKGTTVIDHDGEYHFITSDGYELVDKNQNGFLLSGSTLQPSKMYIKYKGR